MSVCAQTTTYQYCSLHGIMYTTPACPQCAPAAPSPDVDRMRLHVQSRTIDLLEQQIAALRRRVAELEHGRIAQQRAHNALADHVDQLTEAHNNLVVYTEAQLREIEGRL